MAGAALSRLPRQGRTAAYTVEQEIAHLRDLDLKKLRVRWKGQFRSAAPEQLPRHLLFAVLAYQLQADRLGDLHPDVRKVLDRIRDEGKREDLSAPLAKFDQRRRELALGTTLTRDWRGKTQRVMVTANGFRWNGKVYESLSKVALAITRTRWNGPRFFGLRDAPTHEDHRLKESVR